MISLSTLHSFMRLEIVMPLRLYLVKARYQYWNSWKKCCCSSSSWRDSREIMQHLKKFKKLDLSCSCCYLVVVKNRCALLPLPQIIPPSLGMEYFRGKWSRVCKLILVTWMKHLQLTSYWSLFVVCCNKMLCWSRYSCCDKCISVWWL